MKRRMMFAFLKKLRKKTASPEVYFCDHCDKETLQEYYPSGHERDSTYDKLKCIECGWELTGWSGKYQPPLDVGYEID